MAAHVFLRQHEIPLIRVSPMAVSFIRRRVTWSHV